jgi:opacity protein-like surface antigen
MEVPVRTRFVVRLLAGTALLLAIATPAAGQGAAPGVLLGGGVSFLIDEETATGLSVNVNKDIHNQGQAAIGVAGDFGLHRFSRSFLGAEASATITTFLVGPRVTSTPNGALAPFGQFMIGFARAGVSLEFDGDEILDESASGFGFSVGGGLNMKATDNLNFLVQVDYQHFSLEAEGATVSGGVVRFLVGVSTRIAR